VKISIHKIAGFTLNEVLIVMVISTIVVGLAYTAINLLTKNVYNIQENYRESDAVLLLEQRLTLDFNRFPTVSYSEFEDKLKFASPLDSIQYAFEEDFILRNTDTIFISIKDKSLLFMGDKITNGLVDALSLTVGDSLQSKQLFIFKENDALIKLQNGN